MNVHCQCTGRLEARVDERETSSMRASVTLCCHGNSRCFSCWGAATLLLVLAMFSISACRTEARCHLIPMRRFTGTGLDLTLELTESHQLAYLMALIIQSYFDPSSYRLAP